jgi:hypothetical protein
MTIVVTISIYTKHIHNRGADFDEFRNDSLFYDEW